MSGLKEALLLSPRRPPSSALRLAEVDASQDGDAAAGWPLFLFLMSLSAMVPLICHVLPLGYSTLFSVVLTASYLLRLRPRSQHSLSTPTSHTPSSHTTHTSSITTTATEQPSSASSTSSPPPSDLSASATSTDAVERSEEQRSNSRPSLDQFEDQQADLSHDKRNNGRQERSEALSGVTAAHPLQYPLGPFPPLSASLTSTHTPPLALPRPGTSTATSSPLPLPVHTNSLPTPSPLPLHAPSTSPTPPFPSPTTPTPTSLSIIRSEEQLSIHKVRRIRQKLLIRKVVYTEPVLMQVDVQKERVEVEWVAVEDGVQSVLNDQGGANAWNRRGVDAQGQEMVELLVCEQRPRVVMDVVPMRRVRVTRVERQSSELVAVDLKKEHIRFVPNVKDEQRVVHMEEEVEVEKEGVREEKSEEAGKIHVE